MVTMIVFALKNPILLEVTDPRDAAFQKDVFIDKTGSILSNNT